MNTKKFKSLVVASFCFALLTIVAPIVSNAQGKYANRYSKRDVNSIINKLEQSSNSFRRDFDRYMDSSSYNGTNEEDRLNDIVRNYERALNRLRRDFDRSDNWWQSRNNVEDVMDEARQVNLMMNNLNFARRIERQWNQMRKDINKLADTYDLPDLSSGWGDGGGSGNVPNWAIGRFYGRNPQTGGTIMLDINNNGNVVVTFENGSTNYATLNGNRLNNNGSIARVTRINNGIRTTSPDGQSIDYYTSNNGNGGWNNGNNNSGGNVPSWAIGRFYGRNPQTGGTIMLDISRDGSVVVTFENGSKNYATLNGDRLNNNGSIARVTRINNGIRTTSPDGQSIDYTR